MPFLRRLWFHALVGLAAVLIVVDAGSRIGGGVLSKDWTNYDELRQVSHQIGALNGRFVVSLNDGYAREYASAVVEGRTASVEIPGVDPGWSSHFSRPGDLYWSWQDQNVVTIPSARKWVYLLDFYLLGVDVDWAVQPSSMSYWPGMSTQPACYTALVAMPLCVIWGGALMIAAWIMIRRIRRRRATAAPGLSI